MSSVDINPNRGYGTGAGRRKRAINKQSIFFDKDMWEKTRLLAQRLTLVSNKRVPHSVILRRAMQIGVGAIGTALSQGQTIKIDDEYEKAKRSIYFFDDVWDSSDQLAEKLDVDHSVVIRYAIRIGTEAMENEVHRG